MEIQRPELLDAHILLGIVNERLRLSCENLGELEEDLGISGAQLEHKLGAIGFHYLPEQNQFRREE
ncbi:DUF4250 domain-containing protein [Ferrimonas sp. YFM]|uniref:DUF4250 domain-containing protein n=1 Tax=Ferrimonas sp. YFM TaxID=3028878 RepID=UPI0025733149|nr:DUF4250 domain-containing protein [Ferrimonas sp. YFM]BDY03443.1 hypothetical protein F0521_04840 [Ferrimonas sp. YFM]